MFVSLRPKSNVIGARFFLRADLVITVDKHASGGSLVSFTAASGVAQVVVMDEPQEVVDAVSSAMGRSPTLVVNNRG